MSQSREIITLQVGHYANFIGTHWWNLQEASFNYNELTPTDINHDYMFSEGVTPYKLQTYVPRLLAIDAKGSLNHLPSFGTLYEPPRTPSPLEASWNGTVTFVQQIQSEKNEFLRDLEKDDAHFYKTIDEDKDVCSDDTSDQAKSNERRSPQKVYNLKNNVEVWSDFLNTHLHPKSIYTLSDVWHQQQVANSEENYWGFMPGKAIMKKETNQEEISDRIRLIAESCGNLQGFQLLSDGHNGMGGVSCQIAQYLADEFSTKDIISFPVTPPYFSAENIDMSFHYLTSLIHCYTELSDLTNLVVPVNLRQGWSSWSQMTKFPYICDRFTPYESSAIIASFLDSATLAYRSRTTPLPMNHLVELLTLGGRKVAAGSFSFPVGLPCDVDILTWLKGDGKVNLVPMTSGCTFGQNTVSECQIVRGLNDKMVRSNVYSPQNSQFSSVSQLYECYLQEKNALSKTRYIASVKDPVKLGRTFPQIFDDNLNTHGLIDPTSKDKKVNVESLPAIAGLHQGTGVGNMLVDLVTSGSKLNISRLPKILEDGIDRDGWDELLENLHSLISCYDLKPNMETDSDDD